MKLVRDFIGDVDWTNGDGNAMKAYLRTHGDDDYNDLLRSQLLEEAGEFLIADRESGPEQVTEEAADLLEVIITIASRHGVDYTDIERKRVAKLSERGGFLRGMVYDPPPI